MQIHLPAKWYSGFIWAFFFALVLSVALSVVTHNLFFLITAPALLLCLIVIYKPVYLYYLLILTLAFSAEVQITQSLGTDFPDEPLMWVLSIVILTAVMMTPALIRKEVLKHPLVLLLILHFCWIIITVMYSQVPLLSLKYMAAKTWYITCFVLATILFIQNERQIKRLSAVLLFSVLCTAMIIVTRHGVFNFSFESVSRVTLPFFRNHVNYAAMLVCVVPIAVGGYFLAKKNKWTWVFIIFLLMLAVFLSYSRGAWIAIVAGGVTALAIRYKRVVWLYAGMFIAFICVVIYFSRHNRYLDYRPDFYKTIYHEDFRRHMQATYQFQDLSTAERFYRWIAAVRMMDGHWLTGYGPNNFYPNYKRFAVTDFRTYVSDNKEKSTVHNYFLLLLTEQGMPGLAIFLLLLFCMLTHAQKIYHRATDKFHKTVCLVIAAILGIITVLISLSDLIETDKIGSLFFLCLGVLIVMDNLMLQRFAAIPDIVGCPPYPI